MHGGIASIPEMIARAQRALPEGVRDHIAGAAGTEATLKRNRLGLDCLAFRPRVLRDVSEIDTGTTLLGYHLRIPVVIGQALRLGTRRRRRSGAGQHAGDSRRRNPQCHGVARRQPSRRVESTLRH